MGNYRLNTDISQVHWGRRVVLILALASPVGAAPPLEPATIPSPQVARTIGWDDLMPAEYNPEALFEGVDLSSLGDDDPKAAALMQKLEKLWQDAPGVTRLDGAFVRLPGFAIPLESDTKISRRFILVPYYGACIHVPPPPSNQVVLVEAPQGATIKEAFATVWVSGTLRVRAQQTDIAFAGYTLQANQVEPYEE